MPFIDLREQSIGGLEKEEVHVGYTEVIRQSKGLPVIDRLTWLRMAAAKPAMIPLPREILYFRVGDWDIFCLDSSVIDRNTSSWQYSFTVN